ncbi:aldo-keto reductase family 1 member B1-like [Haliotis rubra]|uniref:aldo-keto reductase family 1 member B1-like n=1 Tax=Haliotis rubra TaxID=36100 RepID=UPI001EE554C1|nr:aldo-keto reductase family 1 member B1-like [Haliotis rubra]
MAAVPVVNFSNGKSMPSFGLGTWKSPKGEVAEAVKVAIAFGYRHIDCAWVYGNEEEVGQAINAKIDDGTVKREDLFITTKLWNTFHRPDLVEAAMKESLQRLGLSYVDLYLIHWPVGFKEDTGESFPKDADGTFSLSDADYLDTWKEMESLVEKGLTRSIGVSNFNSEQIQRILQMEGLKHAPVNNQVEISPYITNDKLISFCREKGIVVTAYSPLGSADHPLFKSDPTFRRVFDEPSLQAVAKKYGKSVAQVALRWGIQRNTVVIPKSVTPSRIQENFQIFDFQLTQEEMAVVSALNRNFRACAFDRISHGKYYPFYAEF